MDTRKRRERSIREYIQDVVSLVEDYEAVLLEGSLYDIDKHARKIRDKINETSEE